MRFTVLALDYDGTIADDGVLDPEVRRAICRRSWARHHRRHRHGPFDSFRTRKDDPRTTHWSPAGWRRRAGWSVLRFSRSGARSACSRITPETFTLSTDPLLIDKVRDIVGLYMQPRTHAVVFCVDETSQIQAHPAGVADAPWAIGAPLA